MTFTIQKAKRSSAKPLIGFYARSGRGKTLSALFLARGFVGPQGRILMIESESGRGEAHTDTEIGGSVVGGFDVIRIWEHGPDEQPFSPRRYGAAIDDAEAGKYDALIIDSASHEWEGAGGVLSMAADNDAAGKKGMQVWQKPKIDHQRHFMLKLMQTPIPLVIVNMRAKYPMEEVVNPKTGRKEMQRSTELEPKQSEDVLFEMFVHGWFDDEYRFHGTKYTKPELAQVIPSGQVITNATGEALAAWSRGERPKEADPVEVMAAIHAATSQVELDAVKPLAGKLSEENKKLAREAFKERAEQLKGKTQ